MSISNNDNRCSLASIDSSYKIPKYNDCTANESDVLVGNNDTLNQRNSEEEPSTAAKNNDLIAVGTNDYSVEKLGKADNRIIYPIQPDSWKYVLNSTAIDNVDSTTTNNCKPSSASLNAIMKPTNYTDADISLEVIPVKKRKIEIIEQRFFFPKDIQTELSIQDIDMLFKYYQESLEERNTLLMKISTLIIDVEFFKGNDKKTRFYTGLPTWSLLKNFCDLIEEFLPTHFNCKLSRFRMVVLTLMKLRLNLTFTDIGYRFQIDETTASRYFHRCIFILFKLFENSQLIYWPQKKNLLLNTPSYFRSTFKEMITIIVDCFELFIERSPVLKAAAQAFSYYKHHPTLKYLIGISVTGAILFVSRGYGGRASDKEVVTKSGFLNLLSVGDVVLGDKGFLIENEVNAKDATLKTPSFVHNGEQLHPTEVEQSRDYSRVRIHVERVICVLREKFNMCSDTARMSAISKQNDLFDNDLYDKIIFVCSCLVNICPSVVPNDFEM